MNQTIASIFLVAIQTYAASAVAPPLWIDGTAPSTYAGAGYMIAVGSGSSRIEAASDAKRTLSETFGVQVKSSLTQSSQANLTDDTRGVSHGHDTSNTSSEVILIADTKLRGIEIKEYYQDPRIHAYYALAVLDKNKAKLSYLNELNGLSVKVQSLIQDFKMKNRPSILANVETLLEKYDRLAAEATVLGAIPSRRPISQSQFDELDQKASEESMKDQVYVSTHSDEAGEFSDRLQTNLLSCLSDRRIRFVTEEPKEASPGQHRIHLTITKKRLALNVEGFIKVQFRVKAEVLKGKTLIQNVSSEQVDKARDEDAVFEIIRDPLMEKICTGVLKALSQ